MQRTWFISDTHFSHARIIDLCNRPFANYEEMNEALVANWNTVVSEDDVVFHLGDVALGPVETWDGVLSRLNGMKILIVGNHDRIFGANKPNYIDRFNPIYRQWFDDIYANYEGFELPNGQKINMSHFPYNGNSHDEERHAAFRLEDNGVPLVHGHTHADKVVTFSAAGTAQIHVGVDSSNYTPVSDQQVMDYLRVADDLR